MTRLRSSSRHWLPATLAAAVAISLGGCSTLGTIAYLIQPNDLPAEYDGLKGKHVAIVCRPIVELEFSDAGSARELASIVGALMKQNIRSVKVISQQEVARWIDENDWVDYTTLGKALDADMVVGIDLEQFRIHEGTTLYRGRASAVVQVFDVAAKDMVFQQRIDDFAYPGNGAVPSTDRSESQFRAMFLQILGRRMARLFHAHDSRSSFAEENLGL
ncbi:MAG: hypothetical protein ACKOYJ_07270 [Planctomycetia bacterium]